MDEREAGDDGVRLTVDILLDGQRWLVTWSDQKLAPAGTNHGSSGVCVAGDDVVVVSRDGERWELPAGRPEGDESLLETLRREVREEACCEVESARLLGFTTSTCLAGHEEGTVLVRAHWAARVRVDAWRPAHEIAHRQVVPVARCRSMLTMEPGLEPVYQRVWDAALSE